MPVTLRVNGHSVPVPAGVSLFTAAEQAGIRVPTSCVTPGKCKECVVEITQGMELLTAPTEFEKHLDVKARFRLSCPCRVAAGTGEVEFPQVRPGPMRIERRALDLPATPQTTTLDPAVVRDGDRIVDATTGEEIARSTGPVHGLAIDLGTTTVVMRLIDLE